MKFVRLPLQICLFTAMTFSGCASLAGEPYRVANSRTAEARPAIAPACFGRSGDSGETKLLLQQILQNQQMIIGLLQRQQLAPAPQQIVIRQELPPGPPRQELPPGPPRQDLPGGPPRQDLPGGLPRQDLPGGNPRQDLQGGAPLQPLSPTLPKQELPGLRPDLPPAARPTIQYQVYTTYPPTIERVYPESDWRPVGRK